LPALAAALVLTAGAAHAGASCSQVRTLLRQGRSIDEVIAFTGMGPADIQACAAGRGRSIVVQPAGPPPHGAAGPAPSGAAGPPPSGAAGPPPHGAAGPAPHGAPGPAPGGFIQQ
jgi:hypothetical protein